MSEPTDISGFDPKVVTISFEQLETAGAKSKSQIIRYLDSLGYERAAIAKFLDIKYQHVRNVLTQPQKRLLKLHQEAARLTGKHPSTLTERQKALMASPLVEADLAVAELRILGNMDTQSAEDADEKDSGWISPALKQRDEFDP